LCVSFSRENLPFLSRKIVSTFPVLTRLYGVLTPVVLHSKKTQPKHSNERSLSHLHRIHLRQHAGPRMASSPR
jgi:hypothetical protein